MIKNEKLTSLQLHKDECGYYLEAIYEYETESGKYRNVYPHIVLNTNEYRVLSIDTCCDKYSIVNLGFGNCALKETKVNLSDGTSKLCKCYTEIVEEYPKELTLEEIEKELGYKIKIVGKAD